MWVQPEQQQRQTYLATFAECGQERQLGFRRLVATNERRGCFARQKRSLLAIEPTPRLTCHQSSITQVVKTVKETRERAPAYPVNV